MTNLRNVEREQDEKNRNKNKNKGGRGDGVKHFVFFFFLNVMTFPHYLPMHFTFNGSLLTLLHRNVPFRQSCFALPILKDNKLDHFTTRIITSVRI